MAYPNISDFYWKATWNSTHVQYLCGYYVKRFTQVFTTAHPKERISIRHTTEKFQEERKRQCSLLVNLSKSEQHFFKQHTLTETKNVLVVGHGSTLRKKKFWLVRLRFTLHVETLSNSKTLFVFTKENTFCEVPQKRFTFV